jgi:enoyl-CoA hydratase/carnithine racemase
MPALLLGLLLLESILVYFALPHGGAITKCFFQTIHGDVLTGDLISADEAEKKGLINKSIPGEELENYVLEKAKKISSKSRQLSRLAKKAFYRQIEMPLDQGL